METMRPFGCLANSEPGSPEPTSGRLVACLSILARLYQCKEGALARLAGNAKIERFHGARLR